MISIREPFLAVDPGLRGCGVAVFAPGHEGRGILQWATWVENQMLDGRGPDRHGAMARRVYNRTVGPAFSRMPTTGTYEIRKLVIEFPRIYPHGPKDRRSDPNDLLDVAGVAGACAALFEEAFWVFPSEWKGQVPKEIMVERVKKRLAQTELERVISMGAKDHNTFDAIGIGLHYLGRLAQAKGAVP